VPATSNQQPAIGNQQSESAELLIANFKLNERFPA
jgi:hypothetical protein